MRHRELAAVVGQGLENYIGVLVAFFYCEDRLAAHAVEGFRDDIFLLGEKRPHFFNGAGYQRQRRALRDPGRVGLFVHVAQCLRMIDDQRACRACPVEDVGGVHVLHIERRVLAHQDDVEIAEVDLLRRAGCVPVAVVIANLEQSGLPERLAAHKLEIALLEVMNFGVAACRFEQHRERAVLVRRDGLDRVHHDADFQ